MKTSDLIPVFNQPEEKMREIQREAAEMTEIETAGVVRGTAKLKGPLVLDPAFDGSGAKLKTIDDLTGTPGGFKKFIEKEEAGLKAVERRRKERIAAAKTKGPAFQ